MVYVISQERKPLMPCSHVIARLLLKQGKAKVLRKSPFTIKLLYPTTIYTQELTLGIDTGSSHIGAAVSDSKGNIYYMSSIHVRKNIIKKMSEREQFRRNRRTRKIRYRKSRFLNRKNLKKKGSLNPTMRSKLHAHVREIEYIKSILPISKLVLETATFDSALLKDPRLANEKFRHWGYQRGTNYGFDNTKAMVLDRDDYTCQHCKGKHKDSKLDVHHIVFRSQGGSDEQENLITLCHTCHTNLHEGKFKLRVKGKVKGGLKHTTHMNILRKRLLNIYPDAIETFGYITKVNRQLLGLPKDHHYDACVIATGGIAPAFKTSTYSIKRCVPKGDYRRTLGVRSERKVPKGKIMGFKRFDKVKYFGKEYFINGRYSTGYALLSDIEGKIIDFSYMPKGLKTPKFKNFRRISARTSCLCSEKAILL